MFWQEHACSALSGIAAMACPSSRSAENSVSERNDVSLQGPRQSLGTSNGVGSDAVPWKDCLEAVVSCLRTHVHDAALLHKACNALWVLLRRAACEIKCNQLRGEGGGSCYASDSCYAQVPGHRTKEDVHTIHNTQNISKARGHTGREASGTYLPGEGTNGVLYCSLGEDIACACAEALLSTMCR